MNTHRRDYEWGKCGGWFQNLGDYSDLYLKADVLLLCDVFENFRKISLEKHKLDPAHYYTAPGLSWDSMLKLTKIELELLTDIDMIAFFKKGIRGGISQCSERKHIANNQFLPNYDANETTSFISYLDATNLYGHSITQALPTGAAPAISFGLLETFIREAEVFKSGFVDWHKEYNNSHFPLSHLRKLKKIINMNIPDVKELHYDFNFLLITLDTACGTSDVIKKTPELRNRWRQ
ncbi:hypothetical protein NQ317_013162 [Molorchus minor]|uniref:DNA-directed DNA polymerase n=1 Tax=Molorchus minor TaxID=1323400 RepID=A0ABQ9JWK4_9CUCU|nr:hypothetical protein NQ317_013162 [Molorchus minor]